MQAAPISFARPHRIALAAVSDTSADSARGDAAVAAHRAELSHTELEARTKLPELPGPQLFGDLLNLKLFDKSMLTDDVNLRFVAETRAPYSMTAVPVRFDTQDDVRVIHRSVDELVSVKLAVFISYIGAIAVAGKPTTAAFFRSG